MVLKNQTKMAMVRRRKKAKEKVLRKAENVEKSTEKIIRKKNRINRRYPNQWQGEANNENRAITFKSAFDSYFI